MQHHIYIKTILYGTLALNVKYLLLACLFFTLKDVQVFTILTIYWLWGCQTIVYYYMLYAVYEMKTHCMCCMVDIYQLQMSRVEIFFLSKNVKRFVRELLVW